MSGAVQFVRKPDSPAWSLLNCTGGGSHDGATVMVEIDGVWDGVATCDDERHAAKAVIYALDLRAFHEGRIPNPGGDR